MTSQQVAESTLLLKFHKLRHYARPLCRILETSYTDLLTGLTQDYASSPSSKL